MTSKTYSSRSVNQIQLTSLLKGRCGQSVWVGVDVGKESLMAVLNWGTKDFERPWKIENPLQIGWLITHLKTLSIDRQLIIALEPSGTYGDAFRQACHDAKITVHRIGTKASHDYAEVFDGVPSQHDGKDAALLGELSRLGKGTRWDWESPSEVDQQIEYEVTRMIRLRRDRQAWCGRLEAKLSRHWPELSGELMLTSPTLLKTLARYGGPAPLVADPDSKSQLRAWGHHPLKAEKIDRILSGARTTVGVRQTAIDLQILREYAQSAIDCADAVKSIRKRLKILSKDHPWIRSLGEVVGHTTACVLHIHLGDVRNYHCAGAYVKAMGLNLKERSSGKFKGQLKISKRGSSAARYWMYLAALRRIKKNAPVRKWYLKKKQRDGHVAGRAIIGIVRRLARALYHVGALGEAFDEKRLFPGKPRRSAGTKK